MEIFVTKIFACHCTVCPEGQIKNLFLWGLGPNDHIWAFVPETMFSAISK